MGKPKHIRWINIAKLICILAVISQHAGLELALPYPLYRATELAVPTFFLFSGITLFLSCQRNAEKKIFPRYGGIAFRCSRLTPSPRRFTWCSISLAFST